MSQPIQRQADQWSLQDRQASSTHEPSQAELRDLLSGPKIQGGLLNTREASRRHAEDATPSGGRGHMVPMTPGTADQVIGDNPNFQPPSPPQGGPSVFGPWQTGGGFPGFDHSKGIPDDAQPAIVGDATGTLARRKHAVPRETPSGNLNMSPRKLDQQVTREVQNKALKPPKPKPIPDDLGQDKSFKVPNQLQAHRDPPLPGRDYLASFFRHADGKKIVPGDPSTYFDQNYDPTGGMLAPAGSPTPSSGPPSGKITMGDPTSYPGVNSGPVDQTKGMLTPGGTAAPPAAAPAAQQPTPATTVGDTKPSPGAGTPDAAPAPNASGTGGGGGDTGGGWTARDIAPGSIDTSSPYTVQKGDTLSNIAQGAGLSDYNDLAKSNNIADPNMINEGQQINFSPSPGGPGTSVSDTPAAFSPMGVGGSDFPQGTAPDMPEAGPGGIPLGATSATPKEGRKFMDPPLPPNGQLKKFLGGNRRHLAETAEEAERRSRSPANTAPGLNNPPAPQAPSSPSTPWITPKPSPTPSTTPPATTPGLSPTPSQQAGQPVTTPPLTPAPSQPTVPNTPAPADATQGTPGKTNDLAGAANPLSPTGQPSNGPTGGNNPSPSTPQTIDQPKTPGTYGPDIGGGNSLSDAMGVIGGIGQGINTALSIGGTLAGALSGGGIGSLISGFGGLGMLGSSLGSILGSAQHQIHASEQELHV